MSECSRGKRYPTEMDIKIAMAEHLRHGRRVSGYQRCNLCGGYHFPRPQRQIQKCWATAKVMWKTEGEARAALAQMQAKGREEKNYYHCRYCDCYHTTSADREDCKM